MIALAAKQHQQQHPLQHNRLPMRIVILVSHKLPEWALSRDRSMAAGKYGDGRDDATNGRIDQHSVGYDIDHPAAMRYMTAALSSAARLFDHCGGGLFGWILANEPNFYGSASHHAATKYATRLRQSSTQHGP